MSAEWFSLGSGRFGACGNNSGYDNARSLPGESVPDRRGPRKPYNDRLDPDPVPRNQPDLGQKNPRGKHAADDSGRTAAFICASAGIMANGRRAH